MKGNYQNSEWEIRKNKKCKEKIEDKKNVNNQKEMQKNMK